MIDFTQEFWHTAITAWGCGVISVLCAIEAWRQKQLRWQLIGGILAGLTGVLCPATLTRGYYEMVKVNQELVTMVAAKKAQGVNDGGSVRLVASDVVESGSGRRYERIECRDGDRTTSTWMRDFHGRAGSIDVGVRPTVRQDRFQSGSFVGMPTKKNSGVRWY